MNRHRFGGGGDFNVFRGPPYQQGFGLGGSFRRFFRWIVPIVKSHALPAIQSGLKDIGTTALNSVGDFAKDVAQGRNVHESANQHFDTAVGSIRAQVEKKLKGGRRKRVKHKPQIILTKHKREYDDIFN